MTEGNEFTKELVIFAAFYLKELPIFEGRIGTAKL